MALPPVSPGITGPTSFGILLFAGFSVGIGVTYFRLRRTSVSPGTLTKALLACLFGFCVAGRIPDFVQYALFAHRLNWPDPLFLWGPLNIPAAIVGSAAAVFLALRPFDASAWSLLDGAAPAIALGLALVRIGCLFVPCCLDLDCAVARNVILAPDLVMLSLPPLFVIFQAIALLGISALTIRPAVRPGTRFSLLCLLCGVLGVVVHLLLPLVSLPSMRLFLRPSFLWSMLLFICGIGISRHRTT